MPLTDKKFFVLVNGFHAVVLRNAGTATQPHMEQVWTAEDVLSHTVRPRVSRPGRVFESASRRRSAYEAKSHLLSQKRLFLENVMHKLEQLIVSGECDAIVLIAAPSALGILRAIMPRTVAHRITLEVAKDYAKSGVKGLESKVLHYIV